MTVNLHNCAIASMSAPAAPTADNTVSWWEWLLSDTDDRRMWQVIDWQGKYKDIDYINDYTIGPTDEEFREFYEDVYNPHGVECLEHNEFRTNVTIPILDDDITIDEVSKQVVHRLKHDRACGPDGISPGIIKILPARWTYFILMLFNSVFSSGCYPVSWQTARMVTIFKKGDRTLPKNYRGINIINCLAKLYDRHRGAVVPFELVVRTIPGTGWESARTRLYGTHRHS